MTLRVAVDANALAWGWGGIPKYIDRISRELAATDDVEVTLLANTRRPRFSEIPGVRHETARRKTGTLWRSTFVSPWLAKERPDVYWAPEGLAPFWRPVPTVVTVHDLATVLYPDTKPLRLRLNYRLTIPRTARSATRVIAVSETTAADLRRLWDVPAAIIRVAPNGVDDAFRPASGGGGAATATAGLGFDPPFVLHVGTLEPRKGLDLFAETAAESRRRGLPWSFVAVGAEGFRGAEIATSLRAAGCAVIGPVGDGQLVQLYRNADAVLATSLYEGFGVTPLEAMACGCPAVVAGGAGALEEVSGPAAVVVHDRTPDAWLAALEEVRTRRTELVERGLVHAARFRWPEVARQVRAVLEEAAAAGR